jgi:hypothetical protein
MPSDDLLCFTSTYPAEDMYVMTIIFHRNERVKKLAQMD